MTAIEGTTVLRMVAPILMGMGHDLRPCIPLIVPRSRQRGMAYATDLILQTCRASPDPFYLRRLRTDLTRTGIKAAVATHDTPVLFGWLMDMVSYQGVSDAVAWTYMEQHGRITWGGIESACYQNPPCPTLAG